MGLSEIPKPLPKFQVQRKESNPLECFEVWFLCLLQNQFSNAPYFLNCFPNKVHAYMLFFSQFIGSVKLKLKIRSSIQR